MNVENSANPVDSSAELYVESETVQFNREPPPPYALPGNETQPPVSTQPNAQQIKQTVIPKLTLKSGPTFCQCFQCGHKGLSKVEFVNTNKTHLLAGCICGTTCWCCICCLGAIPYCIKACKKTSHYCSNCETYLGSYSSL